MDAPRTIGKYEILGKLGAGGMAEVYLARRTGAAGFEKKVALKRLAAHAGDDEVLVKSLINEATLVAQLSHPNLVQVFEFELIDKSYCMAMEYIDGVTLETVLNRCRSLELPIPRGLVVYLALEVCAGLDYAHSATSDDGTPFRLVHRDIKPSNIMISRRGQVKIMDFGIAKATTNPYKTTRTGGVKGTLAYMSPEQLAGANPLEPTSDLFSLGLILYEAATLDRLFDDTNLFRLAAAVQQGLRPEARERLQAWFPELVPIVDKLLQLEPPARYADARALTLALRPLAFQSGALEMAEFLQELSSGGGTGDGAAGTVASGNRKPIVLSTGASAGAEAQHPSPGRISATAAVPTPSGQAARSFFGGAQAGSPESLPEIPRTSPAPPPAPVAGRPLAPLLLTGLGAAVVGGLVLTWAWPPAGSDPHAGDEGKVPSVTVVTSAADGLAALPGTNADRSAESGPSGGGDTRQVVDPSASAKAPPVPPIAGPAASVGGEVAPARGPQRVASDPPARTAAAGNGQTSPSGSSSTRPQQRETPASAAGAQRAPEKQGMLILNAEPWAIVYLDGVERGTTLWKYPVTAGVHDVRLVSGDKEKRFKVDVPPDGQVLKIWSFKSDKWVE